MVSKDCNGCAGIGVSSNGAFEELTRVNALGNTGFEKIFIDIEVEKEVTVYNAY